ncbi:hypothetical protein NQ318_010348 [Aromia moschata]|uniref:Uncharacterized protein n=1 Tax=Aromia moschata TaxID=1265417 RepID=A0AAV8XD03_9CUCU|nr:hypothetical protein NQ318_010348 [Aromia moschata]
MAEVELRVLSLSSSEAFRTAFALGIQIRGEIKEWPAIVRKSQKPDATEPDLDSARRKPSEEFCFQKSIKFGSTAGMPASPLIVGLLGTAGVLATGVCLVLAALCRRHYHHHGRRQHRRPDDGGSKHVPMEAVIAADDLMLDGSVTGVRTPLTPEPPMMAPEPVRNCSSAEGVDPDIIRNQYERRPMGFMKVYEPPGSREEEDLEEEGEEYDFRHVAKETHNPSQTVYRSLQRPSRNPGIAAIPGTQTLTHKYRGPEVVTTSNRIQESCI